MEVRVDSMVWLRSADLAEEQKRNLRVALSIFPRQTYAKKEAPKPILLFEEDNEKGLFGIPRGFYAANNTGIHTETLAVSDGMPMASFGTSMRFEGKYAEQEEALTTLALMHSRPWSEQMLVCPCGWGKTNVALEYARRLGRRTLIIVHKSFFLRQWTDRIKETMPGATIGVIQGDRCIPDADFVIGMVHSLVNHVESLKSGVTKYRSDLLRLFGTVIVDEAHRIGAATWSEVMKWVPARRRLAVTATPRRKDGAENVFRHHIGPVTFVGQTNPIVPKIKRVFTDSVVTSAEVFENIEGRWHKTRVEISQLSPGQIEAQLIADKYRTRQVAEVVKSAVDAGRKIMVIASQIEHLWDFCVDIKVLCEGVSVDAYAGEWFVFDDKGERVVDKKTRGVVRYKRKTRSEEDLEVAETAQVILSTKMMVEEGLDIPPIDVLVLITPMSDIQQAIGRCQRPCLPKEDKCGRMCVWRAGKCAGKPVPIVVDVIDSEISALESKWDARQKFYASIGAIKP